jgi:hypothetical protein
MTTKYWIATILVVCLTLAVAGGLAITRQAAAQQPAAATSIGTAFTFQGRLTYDDQPVQDDCWMQFQLYDAAMDGNQVGPTLNPPAAIPVRFGLFSVELDFGSVFNGTPLWLDIGVKCSHDSGYTSLGRQKLTSAPYAVNSSLLEGNPAAYFQNASNLNAGTLPNSRFSAFANLGAEGYLGNAAGDLAQNNNTLQTNLNADLLDSNDSSFYLNASNLNAGTLSTDRFSAFADLSADGYLGNATGDLAQNNNTLQTNLNADLLDDVQGSSYERAYSEGTITTGNSLAIEIPHWAPFTIQLGSGWPDVGGVAFITGMENDNLIAITYMVYNGDGTSATGGAECAEANNTVLLTFGSGNYTYKVTCPGEASGAHNLILDASGSNVELRYKVIF